MVNIVLIQVTFFEISLKYRFLGKRPRHFGSNQRQVIVLDYLPRNRSVGRYFVERTVTIVHCQFQYPTIPEITEKVFGNIVK